MVAPISLLTNPTFTVSCWKTLEISTEILITGIKFFLIKQSDLLQSTFEEPQHTEKGEYNWTNNEKDHCLIEFWSEVVLSDLGCGHILEWKNFGVEDLVVTESPISKKEHKQWCISKQIQRSMVKLDIEHLWLSAEFCDHESIHNVPIDDSKCSEREHNWYSRSKHHSNPHCR